MFTDIDGKVHQTWEPEENWQERKNKEIWELGQPYEVTESPSAGLRITAHYDDPDIESITFPIINPFGETPTIAIKGISDISPLQERR